MSDLVGNPEDRFSHYEAHFVSFQSMSANLGDEVFSTFQWRKIFFFRSFLIEMNLLALLFVCLISCLKRPW